MISTQYLPNFELVENRCRYMKADNNLDFDKFLVEVGVGHMGYLSGKPIVV